MTLLPDLALVPVPCCSVVLHEVVPRVVWVLLRVLVVLHSVLTVRVRSEELGSLPMLVRLFRDLPLGHCLVPVEVPLVAPVLSLEVGCRRMPLVVVLVVP